jgi:hypothetical protein
VRVIGHRVFPQSNLVNAAPIFNFLFYFCGRTRME